MKRDRNDAQPLPPPPSPPSLKGVKALCCKMFLLYSFYRQPPPIVIAHGRVIQLENNSAFYHSARKPFRLYFHCGEAVTFVRLIESCPTSIDHVPRFSDLCNEKESVKDLTLPSYYSSSFSSFFSSCIFF